MSGYGLEVTGFIPMPGGPATAASADTSIAQLRSA
jgi:3,4-dihydroxy 2-butanone 4-phosphate synthase / GTP cyclohydrolase II